MNAAVIVDAVRTPLAKGKPGGAYADIGVFDPGSEKGGATKTIKDTGGCEHGGKTYNLKYKTSGPWSVGAIHIRLRELDADNYGEPDGVEWNQKTFYRPLKTK